MIFYLNIPIILLFTGLRLKGAILVVGFLTVLIMAHSIMAMVEFMEVSIYNSVYGDRTAFFTKDTRIDITVYQYIMNIAYPLVLTIYLIIMNNAVMGASHYNPIGSGASRVTPTRPPIPVGKK